MGQSSLILIHTPFGVFYWHSKTQSWQPAVIRNGRIIPVAVLVSTR